ncbi:hypothetical protein BGW38_004234, partial [Lunasporangiospora selenospora]
MTKAIEALISLSHGAIFVYGFQLQRTDKELSNINTIGTSIFFSRGAALCLAFDMALIMIPVCRKLLSYISRIMASLGFGHGAISEGSHSSSTRYHRFIAYHAAFFLIVHVLGHCVNFYRLQQLGKVSALSYHFGTWAGITGYWMLLLLGIMFATAHKKVRDKNFEVFWHTHHLAILVMVFFSLHGVGCFVKTNDGQCRGYNSWRYVVLASLLYLIERIMRVLESRKPIVLTSAVAHPGGAIELIFRDPTFLYRPGQHLYLNIPQLSRYQWHPFTITSSPIEQYITLDIRQDGDWTGQLGSLLGYGPDSPRLEQAQVIRDMSLLPLIRIDGPYGGPKEDVLSFDHVVLIGTGIGITPFSGLLRHIWFRHQETQRSRLKTLDLYWVSRHGNKLDWFRSLFSMEKTMELFRTGLIRIHIYITSPPSSGTSASFSRPVSRRGSQISQETSASAIGSPESRPLRLHRLDELSPRQYSDDDDDAAEHEELLSPKDTELNGSNSLISLTPISSPQPGYERRHGSEGTDDNARAMDALENGEGDTGIIGPDNIHHGRPDFGKVLEDMKQRLCQAQQRQMEGSDAELGSTLMARSRRQQIKVGVFYCGSAGLGRILA